VTSTAEIRPLCGEVGPTYVRRRRKSEVELQRVCNRPVGHSGPHREYDPRTFVKRAEW